MLFSTGGVVIKSASLTGWQVASFRSGVAALALLLLLPQARQVPSVRALPVSVAYAGTMLLFVLANKLTTAANTIFLQSTSLLSLLALGPWLLKERLRPRDFALVVTVAVGLALFFVSSQPAVTAPNPAAGNLLGAVSGLTWALTLLGLRKLERDATTPNPSTTALLAGNLVVFLCALPFALPAQAFEARDVAIILYLGVFQIALAYICLTKGLRGVPAFEASTLLLVEPVFNPVWTWLLLGEEPGVWAITGGALILMATIGNSVFQRNDR